MLGNMIVAMRMWRVIDGWLLHPYIKGAIGRLGDAQPHTSPPSSEGNYRDRDQTKENLPSFAVVPGNLRHFHDGTGVRKAPVWEPPDVAVP